MYEWGIIIKLKLNDLCFLQINCFMDILFDVVVTGCPLEIGWDTINQRIIRSPPRIFFDQVDVVAMIGQDAGHRQFLQQFVSFVFVDGEPLHPLRRHSNPSAHIARLEYFEGKIGNNT